MNRAPCSLILRNGGNIYAHPCQACQHGPCLDCPGMAPPLPPHKRNEPAQPMKEETANLGLATTRDLLAELRARIEVQIHPVEKRYSPIKFLNNLEEALEESGHSLEYSTVKGTPHEPKAHPQLAHDKPHATDPREAIGDRYEHITAVVDCGSLHWEYKLVGALTPGRMDHDEDVEEWDNEQIIDVTMTTLTVPEDQRALVSVEYA